MNVVMVCSDFDNLRSSHVRFLEQAAQHGRLHVALWSDEEFEKLRGSPPRFREQERLYLIQSLRFVEKVMIVGGKMGWISLGMLPSADKSDTWVVSEDDDFSTRRVNMEGLGVSFHVIRREELNGFPVPPFVPPDFNSTRKRVMVTGSFDWLHSGHVRFFENAAALGDLYVVVGHDANIKLLKGEGHPMFSQAERLYMVHAVRHVHQALVSSGHGWLDAEPEINRVKPHIYVVNEDGDKPEKREFCAAKGIEYVVLKRTPKEGLPRRESTVLRAG